MYDKKVKDKRIERTGESFTAIVEYYRDTPARDRDLPIKKLCRSIYTAKKWLEKFPRDIWDGFSTNSNKYREPDERRNQRTI